ncbi:holo-ACP synthase [Edaphobacter dinghuensis]|uniref:4'-phosphopantetheinyl transferase domain-containing protein n=1 Tax=Edaphobacter dinghuensis TaxID=1560005 RepID=A0A917H7F2_9BACT|nr:4'-phosphopantetheinyl transferase superfamily protein [Edaphobacter dinghuensis]GGG69922.1 hypothetical protein GCM10011585_10030 [Edaphobacter dinghuensis]
MPETEKLRSIVSELMQVSEDQIGDSTVFAGSVLASSLGRARLDAALRSRLNFSDPGVYVVQSFGELCKLAGTEGVGGPSISSLPTNNGKQAILREVTGQNVAVGVDIQSVSDLPEVADYWEAEFYQQHFTRQEIAYALLQPAPRESFAATWCAKEALRKADGRWLGVDWQQTEIAHTSDGVPTFKSGEDQIPCSVSLSHTKDYALAVVVFESKPPVQQVSLPIAVRPSEAEAIPAPQSSKQPLVLAILAFLISLVAVGLALLK